MGAKRIGGRRVGAGPGAKRIGGRRAGAEPVDRRRAGAGRVGRWRAGAEREPRFAAMVGLLALLVAAVILVFFGLGYLFGRLFV